MLSAFPNSVVLIASALLAAAQPTAAQPIDLGEGPHWVADTDLFGDPITFVTAGAVASDIQRIYAIGRSSGPSSWWAYAIDRASGAVLWQTPIDAPVFDSWSAPVIDDQHNSVLVATGSSLRAIDRISGQVLWSRPLASLVVNASPAVTDDLGPRDRALITDYTGFSPGGRLYAINTDPFHPTLNPHQPGDLVWSVNLGDPTSGNTPAYADGVVYLTTAGGNLRAYPVDTPAAPTPLWTTPNAIDFFGGIAIADDGPQRFLYASSYNFTGGLTSANTVKVRASDGMLLWSTPSGRTSSTPTPYPTPLGTRLLLSTGIWFTGSAPAVELVGESIGLPLHIWNSTLDTWVDDGDMGIEPGEFLALGGWTQQPAISHHTQTAYIGTLSQGIIGGYSTLSAIDLTRTPNDPAFVISSTTGFGASPDLAGPNDQNLYSTGPSGLAGFGPPPSPLDTNGDAIGDIEDLYALETGTGFPDPNRDLIADQFDRLDLRDQLRGAP